MSLEARFIQKIEKSTGSAIFDYSLFCQNDRVLVGLSGGKDSLSLLDLLVSWNARSPVKIEIFACYIELDALNYMLDVPALESFCAARKVPFHHRKISTDMNRDEKTDKCFICAWHRRKALFDLARELSCQKLAMGHHLDDILATLLMNMSFRGNFSTMPIKVSLFKGNLTIVRPLGRIEEKDIVKYASLRKLPIQHQDCPHGKVQARAKMRPIIESLASLEPRVKMNMFNSMSNVRTEYLS
jgi:tRNA(Ile)-lysidine synthase TilS/MesJ